MNFGVVGVHAHRTTVNSYRYNFPCVCGHTFPAIILGCYPMIALTTDTFLSMFSGVSSMIQDDDVLLSIFRELSCTILLFMFGVMLRVRGGVATIPSTLIICSSDTEYVDQCVTLTPSSFVSLEQAPLVSGVEKINMEREDP